MLDLTLFSYRKKPSHLQSSRETLGVSLAFLQDLHLSSTMVFSLSPLISLAEDFPALSQTPCSSANATARYKTCQLQQEIFSSAVETQKAPIAVGYCSRMSPMRFGPSMQTEDRLLPIPASPLGIVSLYEVSVVAMPMFIHSSNSAQPPSLVVSIKWDPLALSFPRTMCQWRKVTPTLRERMTLTLQKANNTRQAPTSRGKCRVSR